MRDVIFIVGMGRSGTSALTRVLGLCGAAMPLETLPANFANPLGYWEPRRTVDLNDRFLGAYGRSWYDETLELQVRPPGGEAADSLIAEAAGLLSEAFEPSGPIALKDPRIAGILPYWTAAAERAGMRPTVVHNFRRPEDVAASLERRDGMTSCSSNTLWLKYNLFPERDSRELPRAFVSYEDLMRDWESVVARCAAQIGVPLTVTPQAKAAVGGFLSPALRHHASDWRPHAVEPRDLLGRTYALLNEARGGRVDTAGFDDVRAAYVAHSQAQA